MAGVGGDDSGADSAVVQNGQRQVQQQIPVG